MPAESSAQPVKVLYIMGAGRSGSTALGVALDNLDGVFYAGELQAWLRRSGKPRFDDEPRDRFWTAVRSRVSGADALFGSESWRTIEHSTSVFRSGRRRRELLPTYREMQSSLYRAISEVSGAEWVVDSAHYPLRAKALRDLPALEFHVVLLVRDPGGVVASFGKADVDQPRKSALAANCYLWLTHLLSLRVWNTHPAQRRHFVRFEDFQHDPAAVLRTLPPLSEHDQELPDFSELSTGLSFQGNRLLRTSSISIQPDHDLRARSWLTTTVQRRWTRKFRQLG